MTELIHGGDLYGYTTPMLDFSSNINPLGLPKGVKTALAASIDSWERYPDPLCRDLVAAIARAEEIAPAYIHCGNGAADLLFRIVQAKKPRRALLTAPTFAEYERALKTVGCEITLHFLHEKDGFALTDTLLKKLSPALDLLVLCNPNNPTGQPIEKEFLLCILKKCVEFKITLLIDECFNPFLDEPEAYSLKDQLAEYPNLIIVKAFTKLYAMAGLRLGYLLCSDQKLIEAVAACGQAWNVSMPAQTAGVAALSDTAYVAQTRALISQQRNYLTASLQNLNVTVIGSKANYIFFKCNRCRDLRERLLPRGILIRSCANYHGLDDRFYRIAVKDHAANEAIVHALTEILNREGE
ncbi:threonine-phosphate decarboxylase CobD [Oscillospiraceae bacterium PP1C4]